MTGNRIGQGFAGMPTKQKVMAAVTIVILIVVVWMIVGMLKGNKAPEVTSPPPQMARSMNAASPQNNAMGQPANLNGASGGTSMQQQAPAPAVVQANVMTVNKNADLMKEQQQTQKDYLDKLNELQLLKVQREISETNQAIAAARLATVTADKNMTDLLTKPTVPAAPEVPTSVYANGLAMPIPSGANINNPKAPPAPVAPAVSYVVISVSMQLGTWHAVIGESGKLYNVGLGDVLPPDGSVVTSITSRGVVIEKGDKKQIINLISSI